jgi:hypothetical protein
MTRELPFKLRSAIQQTPWLNGVADEDMGVAGLQHDWVVWVATHSNQLIAGGRRLIVPKEGGRSFTIGSDAAADDESGVSTVYEVIVRASVQPPPTDAACLLGDAIGQRVRRHTSGDQAGWTMDADHAMGAGRVATLRALRAPPATLGFFIVTAPLELRRMLRDLGVRVDLARPDDCGGYGGPSEP